VDDVLSKRQYITVTYFLKITCLHETWHTKIMETFFLNTEVNIKKIFLRKQSFSKYQMQHLPHSELLLWERLCKSVFLTSRVHLSLGSSEQLWQQPKIGIKAVGISLQPYSTYMQDSTSDLLYFLRYRLTKKSITYNHTPSHPSIHPITSISHCRASAVLRKNK